MKKFQLANYLLEEYYRKKLETHFYSDMRVLWKDFLLLGQKKQRGSMMEESCRNEEQEIHYVNQIGIKCEEGFLSLSL